MIRAEQQYEEVNRIKPLHFSPLHLVVPRRSKFAPLSFAETFASLSRIRREVVCAAL
jgi:hypothetical protein